LTAVSVNKLGLSSVVVSQTIRAESEDALRRRDDAELLLCADVLSAHMLWMVW
jgi:hypothetical protein